METSKIEWSIICLPPEIVATCGKCHAEIICLKYEDYKDKIGKLDFLKHCKLKCSKCGTMFTCDADRV